MKPHTFKHIIHNFLQGKTSVAEDKILKDFENKLLAKNAPEVFAHTSAEKVHNEISKEINKKLFTQPSLYRWSVAAAVLLLVIGIASWGWFFSSPNPTMMNSTTQWLSASATQGETLTLTLPDGSTAILNSGSNLRYPATFARKKREVQLDGEAFFEVTSNPKKPFIVKTEILTTEVLGTSFNIEAFPSQNEARVTLVTGKVRVQAGAQQCELHPSQQAVFHKTTQQIQVQTVATNDFTDWKEGILRFRESSLPTVVQKIEKHYGVQIRLEVENAERCYLSGTFVKEDLNVVLKQLTFIHSGLNYEYIDSQHLVLKGKCE
jgi:putative anti-sigma factor